MPELVAGKASSHLRSASCNDSVEVLLNHVANPSFIVGPPVAPSIFAFKAAGPEALTRSALNQTSVSEVIGAVDRLELRS